jgi:hypothetical protein
MAPMITQEERTLLPAVSPFLCEELIILGLDANLCKDQYLIADKKIYLRSYQWDHTGFYKETDQGFFEAVGQPIRRRLPAFTISDMMALLPPFMMNKDNDNDWSLSLDNWYDVVPIEKDRRAPDVVARMVIQLLKRNILTPAMCNKTLTQ